MKARLVLWQGIALMMLGLGTLMAEVTAQPPPGGTPPEGGPPQPPQEAIDACQGQDEGAPCQFKSPRGDVSGTCQQIEEEPVCVPEGGLPQGPPDGAPESPGN